MNLVYRNKIRIHRMTIIPYYSPSTSYFFLGKCFFFKILKRNVLSGAKNSHSRVLVQCMKYIFVGMG